MTRVLIRRGKYGHRPEMHRGRPLTTEAKVGVVHLQAEDAEDCPEAPESGKRQGRILPRAFGGSMGLLTPQSWTSSLKNHKRICLLFQGSRSVVFCDGSPWTLIHFLSSWFGCSSWVELSGRPMKVWGWDAEEGPGFKTEPGVVARTWEWDRGPRRSEERVCRGRRGGGGGRGPRGKGRKGAVFPRRQGSWGPTEGGGRLSIHVMDNLVKSTF